jgi:hypothetical protein
MALGWMGATMALASVVKDRLARVAFDRNVLWDDPDPVVGVMRITAEGSDSAYQKLCLN